MNLDSSFTLDDKTSITFREYFAKKKDNDKNAVQLMEQQEQAMVVHYKYVGRGDTKRIVDTNHFPPQLLFVIVPVEQHNEWTKRQVILYAFFWI